MAQKTYTVTLTGYADIAVDVTADEDTPPEGIVELAQEQAGPTLCHQCADSRNDSLTLGDEWNAVKVDGEYAIHEEG